MAAIAGTRTIEAAIAGAVKGPLPAYVPPMLATLVAEPPAGDDWVHEIKYDGYRLIACVERGRARLYSRNRKDWTASFPAVARELSTLPVRSAWIDGEVVVLDAQGRTSFQALQNALSSPSAQGLAFFAFDLMYLDGYDLRRAALTERKRILRGVVGNGAGAVRVGPEVRGSGAAFFEQACRLGLEGTVAKRAASTYASGLRTREWLKIKCIRRQEMVIAGYTEPQGSRTGFGALLLGYYEDGKLRYAGKVGTGFDERMLRELAPRLASLEQRAPALADPPRGYEAKGAHWVRPDLVAEVAFAEWSRDGALRHPSFQGLRPDKKATDVMRERPEAASTAAKTSRTAKTKHARVEIAGVALSSPDKPYFPEAGLTKRDIAAYYAKVAPHLLPHIAGRPLSLVRCPEGWSGQCFYQKHADKAVNAAVARIAITEAGGGKATYMGASTAAALVALVQWGVIEMHPWGSKAPRLDRPDRLVFDFDPDTAVPFADLAAAVTLLRALLAEMGLSGFLKTTGGKGLHVVVPIRATLPWDDAKAFAKSVADFLVRTYPGRFTASASKAARRGKIFIDYLRNAQGATAIAPYAVRARANAPVATPIAWSELAKDVRNDYFNVRNVPERLASMGKDPWADFFSTRQSIAAAMRRRLAAP
ncbi:MAG TPA: DNA ligase D [Casimicrobiaceae bacterium]|nr:DNA ligase D [Casimicrobiaceae bacterium]